MKGEKRNKLTYITNGLLVLIIAVVFGTGFIPQTTVPIYGGKNVSAIYKGNTNKACVSIMFNVYENGEVVREIIKVLEKHQSKATFFVGGCWADDNQATLKEIIDNGHELGNHGYFHKDHKKMSYEDNRKEILNTGVMVKALTGAELKLFAPPSGSYSDITLSVADDLGYKVIMWSKDTIDWRDSNVETLVNRATKNLTNGDLILMHPKAHSVTALERILEYCKGNGLKVCTVSEAIS